MATLAFSFWMQLFTVDFSKSLNHGSNENAAQRYLCTNLCQFPLCEDMVVSLPYSLDSHGSSKKTIGDS